MRASLSLRSSGIRQAFVSTFQLGCSRAILRAILLGARAENWHADASRITAKDHTHTHVSSTVNGHPGDHFKMHAKRQFFSSRGKGSACSRGIRSFVPRACSEPSTAYSFSHLINFALFALPAADFPAACVDAGVSYRGRNNQLLMNSRIAARSITPRFQVTLISRSIHQPAAVSSAALRYPLPPSSTSLLHTHTH